MTETLRFKLDKETKGAIRYREVGTEIISTVYLRKSWLWDGKPEGNIPSEIEIVLKIEEGKE